MKTEAQLRARLEEIESATLLLKAEMSPLSIKLNGLLSERAELERELEQLKKQPRVSDHAVIRWLERKYGFDFEKQREELLDDNAINAINAGASKINRNGNKLIIKDKTIVTVL